MIIFWLVTLMLQLHSQNVQLCLIYSMFALLHEKYWIIPSYICNGKRHTWNWGWGGRQNKEMTKPVKIVLSCLHVTKLGHCYYFPSFKILGLGGIKIYLPFTWHLYLPHNNWVLTLKVTRPCTHWVKRSTVGQICVVLFSWRGCPCISQKGP